MEVAPPKSPVQIVSVQRGPCRHLHHGPFFVAYSVVVDRVCTLEELAAAWAVWQARPEADPPPPGFVARPPMIYPVGLREDGVLVAESSAFFNLVVRYVPTAPGQESSDGRG